MWYTEHKYYDEFWGAKVPTYEYELEQEYDDEVFEIIKDMIENEGWDIIPDTIEVEAEGRSGEKWFTIDPYEYLTDEQVDDLNNLIEKIYNKED